MTIERNEVALRIFCALMSRTDASITLYPDPGEQQIRTCFMLADTFLKVATSTTPETGDQ